MATPQEDIDSLLARIRGQDAPFLGFVRDAFTPQPLAERGQVAPPRPVQEILEAERPTSFLDFVLPDPLRRVLPFLDVLQERVADPARGVVRGAVESVFLPGKQQVETRIAELRGQGVGPIEAARIAEQESATRPIERFAQDIVLDPSNLAPGVGFGAPLARAGARAVGRGAQRAAPTVRRLAADQRGSIGPLGRGADDVPTPRPLEPQVRQMEGELPSATAGRETLQQATRPPRRPGPILSEVTDWETEYLRAAEGGAHSQLLGPVRRFHVFDDETGQPLVAIAARQMPAGRATYEVEVQGLDLSGRPLGFDDPSFANNFTRREIFEVADQLAEELGADTLVGLRLSTGQIAEMSADQIRDVLRRAPARPTAAALPATAPTPSPAAAAPPAAPPRPPRPTRQAPPPPPEPPDFPGVVTRLNAAIRSAARPTREATEQLRTAEMKRRAGRLASAQAGARGEQAVVRTRGVLRGELPRMDFEPVQMAQPERDLLFDAVNQSDKLRPFERITAADGLTKTLSGTIPTYDEMAKLELVFGEEFIEALLSKRPWGTRLWDEALDAINLPRAFMTSFDLSAALRQGRPFLTTYPKEWKDAFNAMHKAFAKESVAQQVDDALRSRELWGLSQDAGLYHAPRVGRAARLAQREEGFMTRYASKIPWVRMSERAYVTFLNKIRADVFDSFVRARRADGVEPSMDELQQFARHVNWLSGRGSLGPLDRGNLPAILNAAFFAPRFAVSRFQAPLAMFSSNPTVRKRAARDWASFVGSGMMLLFLLDTSGVADVEADPRSSDFGKVRVGNTRWDIWGGFQQPVRNLVQLATLQRKALGTGEVYDIARGDRERATAEVISRFLRTKLSPAGSLAADVWFGKDFLGEDFDPATAISERAWSITLQDMLDAMAEQGIFWGGLASAPAVYGTGVQTFEPGAERLGTLEKVEQALEGGRNVPQAPAAPAPQERSIDELLEEIRRGQAVAP